MAGTACTPASSPGASLHTTPHFDSLSLYCRTPGWREECAMGHSNFLGLYCRIPGWRGGGAMKQHAAGLEDRSGAGRKLPACTLPLSGPCLRHAPAQPAGRRAACEL